MTARTATQDIEVAGQLIREGEQVVVLWRDTAILRALDTLKISAG